jgi:hypothetical protein
MSQTASGQIGEVSKEFWETVGLVLADGSIRNDQKYRKFEIVFAGKEETLIKIFKQRMENLFGNLNFVESVDKLQVKVLRVCKRSVIISFLNFLPQWKRKGNATLKFPSIENISTSNLQAFLRAFFSAEGSVVLGCKWNKCKKLWVINKRIQVTIKNNSLKEFITKVLRKLGFRPAVWKNEVVLTRKQDIIEFSKKVRFFDNVNISKKSRIWFGIEKNKLLDLIADLCEKKMNSFRSIKEWETFVQLTSPRLRVQVSTG